MDPHEREYAGAVAGMTDTYGRVYMVGDRVTWRSDDWPAGVSMTGDVSAVEGDRLVIVDGHISYRVSPSEILPL